MDYDEILATLRKVDLIPENDGVTATCTVCGGHLRRREEHGSLGDLAEAMLHHFAANH